MDHTYIRAQNRLIGYQVIERRSGPDHTYVRHKDCTPQKRRSKRNLSTPTGKTPNHENKWIELDERIKHNRWSADEKSFLREHSQASRKGESENSFWNNCATAMNKKFGGKNRTGNSCKMAAWRLSLTSTSSNTACTSSAAEDCGDFTQLPETDGSDVGTQTVT